MPVKDVTIEVKGTEKVSFEYQKIEYDHEGKSRIETHKAKSSKSFFKYHNICFTFSVNSLMPG